MALLCLVPLFPPLIGLFNVFIAIEVPMKKTLLSLALSTSVLTVNATAQERLETMIVSGTKTPVELKLSIPTANVISRNDIERLQPQDLPSLLGRVAGIDFRDSGGRGSASGVFVRGAAPAQTLVLVDGVRTASGTTGATALASIPLEIIDRIEIVKGPSAGLYGADAVGGVIQIFTKNAGQGTSASIHSSLAMHDAETKHEYGATVTAGNDRVSIVASFDVENDEGLDRTTDETAGNNDADAFDEKSAYIAMNATLSDIVDATAKYYRADNQTQFDNPFGADAGRETDSELEQFTASIVVKANENLRFNAVLGHFVDHLETPAFGSDIKTTRSSADVQADISLSEDILLSSGISYYNDDVETTNNFAESERDNTAFFTQLQASFGQLGVLANIRHDDNEAYGKHNNGTLALSTKATEHVSFVASYGTAFIAPSFNQLYFPNFGNTALNPEESETIQLSGRYYNDNLSVRVSVYHTNVDELIAFDTTISAANNINVATLEGIEFEVSGVFSDWDYSANLDYAEARDKNTDAFLADRTTISANVNIGKAFDKTYVTFYAQGEHGRKDSGELPLGGWVTSNFAVKHDFSDNFELNGGIENLFDKDYVVNVARSSTNNFYRTYGRVVRVGAKYTF